MKKRTYYTLLALRDDRWTIEFGDYSREVVQQEKSDIAERGVRMIIITTSDEQADIEAAVTRLNATR